MGNTIDVEHLRSCVQENRHTVFSIDHQVNFASTDVRTTIFTDFDTRSRAFELHSDVDAVEINCDRVASKVALVVLAVNVQLSGGSSQLDSVQHSVDQNVLVLSIQLAKDTLARLKLDLPLARIERNGAGIIPTEN